MSAISAPAEKLSPFYVSTYAYKVVEDHPILLDVLVPKKLVDGGSHSEKWKSKRPLMVRYHGGWLIGGQRNYVPSWPCWILDIALKNDAIIVNPDYRLIPEATAEDVLDDIADFWQWVGTQLDETIQQSFSGLHPDLSRIIVSGESAGGYLAIQTGLSFFGSTYATSPSIRAVIAQYPAVSWRTPMWTEKYHKDLYGVPQFPESLIDDLYASIAAEREKTGRQPVVSNLPLFNEKGEFNDRSKLGFSIQQNGRYHQVLGPERSTSPGKRRLFPEDRIEDGGILPPIVFIQGLNDTIAPVEGCDKFVDHIRKFKAVDGLAQGKKENEVLLYCKAPGEHSFEIDIKLDEKPDPWVGEVVNFIEGHWLK